MLCKMLILLLVIKLFSNISIYFSFQNVSIKYFANDNNEYVLFCSQKTIQRQNRSFVKKKKKSDFRGTTETFFCFVFERFITVTTWFVCCCNKILGPVDEIAVL